MVFRVHLVNTVKFTDHGHPHLFVHHAYVTIPNLCNTYAKWSSVASLFILVINKLDLVIVLPLNILSLHLHFMLTWTLYLAFVGVLPRAIHSSI